MTTSTTTKKEWPLELLAWYQKNRRDLPWRGTMPRDAYRVWVSEIMLQQTKVETVKPYYENWMDHFPTMEALAQAEDDEVLRQWQGLGYYSRARNLHEAVREVVHTYGGTVPRDKAQLLALKGVGEYTAGAILSIAYGQPEVAVDGNVLRVFARLYNVTGNILSTPVKKEITKLAQQQLPRSQGGAFNEALMDFGAMICIPKSPRCDECPVSAWCMARRAGTERELPLRVTKKHIPAEDIAVVVVSMNQQWLIHRRSSKGLLASMWEFPNAKGRGDEGLAAVRRVVADVGVAIDIEPTPIGKIKHVFSHKIWNMTIYEARAEGVVEKKEDWQWLPRAAYTSVPWAGPHGKITAMV